MPMRFRSFFKNKSKYFKTKTITHFLNERNEFKPLSYGFRVSGFKEIDFYHIKSFQLWHLHVY